MTKFVSGYFSLFLLFLRFGCLAWGGPVAQINMLREELVEKRGWIKTEAFPRILALYQALPGPEAHELCVYFGMVRAGRIGAVLAGLGFMLPGFLLMLALSYAYVNPGSRIFIPYLMFVPAVIAALMLRSTHRISKHTLSTLPLVGIGVISLILFAVDYPLLAILGIAASSNLAFQSHGRKKIMAVMVIVIMFALSLITLPVWPLFSDMPPANVASGNIFLEGLKAGMLTFGGAYTAIPLLQDSMVNQYPAITQEAFLHGIALVNLVPSPLIMFTTYLGFLADGWAGALLITAGTFLPAFAFTLIGHHWLERLLHHPPLHAILDGIAAAVTGLLALSCIILIKDLVQLSPIPIIIFILSLIAFYRIRKTWIIPVMIACAVMTRIIISVI